MAVRCSGAWQVIQHQSLCVFPSLCMLSLEGPWRSRGLSPTVRVQLEFPQKKPCPRSSSS